jgi:hypothetical protein
MLIDGEATRNGAVESVWRCGSAYDNPRRRTKPGRGLRHAQSLISCSSIVYIRVLYNLDDLNHRVSEKRHECRAQVVTLNVDADAAPRQDKCLEVEECLHQAPEYWCARACQV